MSKNTQNEISALLTPYANEIEDERLGIFLSLSVGRVLLKDKTNKSLGSLINRENMRHITDWLKAAIINNESWISNLDKDQRPKKLMKFSSVEDIVKEADKVMLIEAQKNSHIQLNPGDESLYAKLENGHYLVRLLTPEALDRESAQMQHCIGQGGYDHELNKDDVLFLSLRDPSNKAHVTMEVNGNKIIQLQGKQNRAPIDKYIDYLVPFLKAEQYAPNLPLKGFGYMIDDKFNWYKQDELPKYTFTTCGHLDLDGSDISELPKKLIVSGYMSIYNNHIDTFPEFLKVNGILDIKETRSDFFIKNIKVKYNISIEDNDFEKISDNIEANEIFISNSRIGNMPASIRTLRGGLFLTNVTIDSFKSKLDINGPLDIVSCNITELPATIIAHDKMLIEDTDITSLPDNLTIKDNLSLRFCNSLTSLPETLRIGGSLFIKETPNLKSLPEGIEVGVNIILSDSNIEKLPDNLTVKNKLMLNGSKVTTLPKGLKVGVLDISYTDIKELPADIKVWDHIDMLEDQNIIFPDEINDKIIVRMTDSSYNTRKTNVGALREAYKAIPVMK